MIKTHSTFLLHRKIHTICFIMLITITAILYDIASLELPPSTILYQRQMLKFELLYQGILIIKITLMGWMTFLWVYSDYYNDYDVYLYVRDNPLKVRLAKWFVITAYTVFISVILTSILIGLLSVYPIPLSLSFVRSLVSKVVLFSMFYNTLYLLCSTWVRHISSVFVPLGLYFVGMILVDINNESKISENPANYIQLIAPDIVYLDNRIFFLFGHIVVVIVMVVLLQIVFHIFRQKDRL
ncbi:hypothetical protein [Candidatus Xianfuyuplasma coldseepsis]|uniref:Uncharacterized protein n=1 Tax=Candidatus Xianfuyuplasma coldseepsis TaxID=2782163 RepID=A0A7L7KSJ6_9MOLU|nr:hypothetical protein [Xianfuyuplasma coldseepsis]QMS85713.1 hypothetical protein G4Z02_08135 [Xianfuyuplasma coldseepsis]